MEDKARRGPFSRQEIAENGEPLTEATCEVRPEPKRRENYLLCLVALCILLFLACALLLAAFIFHLTKDKPDVCLSEGCIRTAATIMSSMDTSVDPCDDFYSYACGNWIRNHPIPDDSSSVSNFENLSRDLEAALHKLLQERHKESDGEAVRKAKKFYSLCLNESQISSTWRKAFDKAVADFGGWPAASQTPWTLTKSIEEVYGMMVARFRADYLLKTTVQPDDKNSSKHILLIDQPQLNLFAKDFYLLAQTDEERKAYLLLIEEILVLLGTEPLLARNEAVKLLAFETGLANSTQSEEERHDVIRMYYKVTLGKLTEQYPQFAWKTYLNQVFRNVPLASTNKPPVFTDNMEVLVYGKPFLDKFMPIFGQYERRVVVNYLAWCWFFKSMLRDLPDPYALTMFKFYRTLNLMSVQKLRWHGCVTRINGLMSMATSRLYVQEHFNEQAKHHVEQMIDKITASFQELLEDEDWLSPETREVAVEKIQAISRKIGFPDYLNDPVEVDKMYDRYEVSEDDYYNSKFQFYEMYQRDIMERIGAPVNRSRWVAGAAVVNAFYSPNTNEIIFPAAILQPVFYDEIFPWSMNFGGIGVVIGHEITHGFDDRGRLYDKYGNIRLWWDNATVAKFEEKARCIEDQYSSYVLEQVNMRINGRNTKGENIADNGGLKQAYRAYKRWADQNPPESMLPGIDLSHDQLFFLNYAQIWCGSMNDKEAVRKLKTSEHCPGPIRVKGPLSNSYDFARAYKCKVGSKMNPLPKDKCRVW